MELSDTIKFCRLQNVCQAHWVKEPDEEFYTLMHPTSLFSANFFGHDITVVVQENIDDYFTWNAMIRVKMFGGNEAGLEYSIENKSFTSLWDAQMWCERMIRYNFVEWRKVHKIMDDFYDLNPGLGEGYE